MINILTKDRWDYNDVASITVVNSICGDVQETFGALDVDGNGVLDLSELGALLQGLDADISRRPVEELMAELDLNGDGKVSFDEFSKWYIQSEERILGAIKAIFDDVDEDKDGVLNCSEMAAFMECIGVDDASRDHIAGILAKHGVDRRELSGQMVKIEEEPDEEPKPEAVNDAVDGVKAPDPDQMGMRFEDFRAWFVTTSYFEAKLDAFRKQVL